MNILCCLGCCFCTKCSCYQDKDQVVYYKPGNVDFNQKRIINGSDDGSAAAAFRNPDGVANQEREEAERIAGSKLIR